VNKPPLPYGKTSAKDLMPTLCDPRASYPWRGTARSAPQALDWPPVMLDAGSDQPFLDEDAGVLGEEAKDKPRHQLVQVRTARFSCPVFVFLQQLDIKLAQTARGFDGNRIVLDLRDDFQPAAKRTRSGWQNWDSRKRSYRPWRSLQPRTRYYPVARIKLTLTFSLPACPRLIHRGTGRQSRCASVPHG